jgi:hypothetical protein
MAAPLTAGRLEIDWQRDLVVGGATERSCVPRLAAAAAEYSTGIFGRHRSVVGLHAGTRRGISISCTQVISCGVFFFFEINTIYFTDLLNLS